MTDFTHHIPRLLSDADAAADLAGVPRPNDLPSVGTEDARKPAQKNEEDWDYLYSRTGDIKDINTVLINLKEMDALVSERDELASRVREMEANARRYEWIRYGTGGTADNRGRQSFVLPDPHPLGNILKGSVAQHLDAAIDAHINASKEQP